MSDETLYEKKKVPLSGKTPLTPDHPTPTPETRPDGQHTDHWVLSEEDRKRKRVRPVRLKYIHEAPGPEFPVRDLTDEEKERYGSYGYVKFEPWPSERGLGRFWTQAQLDKAGGCGVVTRMPEAIAETYAVDPKFYGSTFCCGCKNYFPVGEFYWDGTKERVGS